MTTKMRVCILIMCLFSCCAAARPLSKTEQKKAELVATLLYNHAKNHRAIEAASEHLGDGRVRIDLDKLKADQIIIEADQAGNEIINKAISSGLPLRRSGSSTRNIYSLDLNAIRKTFTPEQLNALCIKPAKASENIPPAGSAALSKKFASEWRPSEVTNKALNTVNPIRQVVGSMNVGANPDKKPILFNMGDPTISGFLLPSPAAVAAVQEVVDSHKYDGYGAAIGLPAAREAVAQHFTSKSAPISADDVVLTCGASQALQLAFEGIANPGQNILVPKAGFPHYTTLCQSGQIEARPYRLLMDQNGMVDLLDLERQIDANTKAILVNNPSNPIGVVYSKEHLEAILQIADKHKVPIIADEIYGDMVYDGEFYPMAALSPRVPIITIDGISKRFLVPGWRLGWLIVHNRHGMLTAVKQGITALTQKLMGPSTLIQAALPKMLRDTPQSFFDKTNRLLAANAKIVQKVLGNLPGIKTIRPQGAIYFVVHFDAALYGDEKQIVAQMIAEESVYMMPGSVFGMPNWVRLQLVYPEETTREACERIAAYCNRYLRMPTNQNLEQNPIKVPKNIGPVVLITGTSRGLGLEMVRNLLTEDDNVAVVFATYRGQLDGKLKELVEKYSADKLTRTKGKGTAAATVVDPLEMDISKEESIQNIVQLLAQRLQFFSGLTGQDLKLNTLIHNAGYGPHYNIEHGVDPLTPKKGIYMHHFEINSVGPVMLNSKIIAAGLLHPVPERARIVFITSTSGSINLFNTWRNRNVAYGMSKAAMNFYMKGLSLYKTWLTMSICPGWTATEMGNRAKTAANAHLIREVADSARAVLERVRGMNWENNGKFFSFHHIAFGGKPKPEGDFIPF